MQIFLYVRKHSFHLLEVNISITCYVKPSAYFFNVRQNRSEDFKSAFGAPLK